MTAIKLGPRQSRMLKQLAANGGEWDPMNYTHHSNSQLQMTAKVYASMEKHGLTEPLGRGSFDMFARRNQLVMGWRITDKGLEWVKQRAKEGSR